MGTAAGAAAGAAAGVAAGVAGAALGVAAGAAAGAGAVMAAGACEETNPTAVARDVSEHITSRFWLSWPLWRGCSPVRD